MKTTLTAGIPGYQSFRIIPWERIIKGKGVQFFTVLGSINDLDRNKFHTVNEVENIYNENSQFGNFINNYFPVQQSLQRLSVQTPDIIIQNELSLLKERVLEAIKIAKKSVILSNGIYVSSEFGEKFVDDSESQNLEEVCKSIGLRCGDAELYRLRHLAKIVNIVHGGIDLPSCIGSREASATPFGNISIDYATVRPPLLIRKIIHEGIAHQELNASLQKEICTETFYEMPIQNRSQYRGLEPHPNIFIAEAYAYLCENGLMIRYLQSLAEDDKMTARLTYHELEIKGDLEFVKKLLTALSRDEVLSHVNKYGRELIQALTSSLQQTKDENHTTEKLLEIENRKLVFQKFLNRLIEDTKEET